MGILDRLRSRRRMSSALKRAEFANDPSAVEALLRECPQEADRIAGHARQMAEFGSPWPALLLAVELARCGAPQTSDVLRLLSALDFPGWRRLEETHLRVLWPFLLGRRDASLFRAVRPHLDDSQFSMIVRCMAETIEEARPSSPTGDAVDNGLAAAEALWVCGCADEALQIWALIAAIRPEAFDDAERLGPVAQALPGWVPRRRTLRIEGLPDDSGGNVIPVPFSPPPSRVARAADLLGDFPRAQWVEPLRQAWLAVDDLVRRDGRDEAQERDPRLLMPAQSIAAALGACAAMKREAAVLVRDEAGRTARHEALGREIDRRNELVDRYKALVDEYQSGAGSVGPVRKLADKISRKDEEIERSRKALRGELAPAALLLHTVSDEQSYPLEVRQGAAWGLHRIVEAGALEEKSRGKVREVLGSALREDEVDEAGLRDRIAAALPDGDTRLREVLVAAEAYGEDRDAERLAAALKLLAPDVPLPAQEICSAVDASRRPRDRDKFCERVVRILPDATLQEFVAALRRGLRWMVELVEGQPGPDPAIEKNLQWIASLVREQLPGVTSFLSRYPLRLMTLSRHRHILGQYLRDQVQIEFWTRYSPPRWFRGAKLEDLGEVHRRYLEIDDRSTPNAMGIYYRLFEHPLLVLPVLYHEFLHYGGRDGDPAHGIENETEVLLREVIFARHLLARLAPEDDAGLPGYEEDLAETIRRTELVGLAAQLFYDFDDGECLAAINDGIERAYGPALDPVAARTALDHKIRGWNRLIDLENHIDESKRSWHPEINWPLLDAPETRGITDTLRKVLDRALRRDNRLSAVRRSAVLAEPAVCRQRGDWSAYTRRPGTVVRFASCLAPAETRLAQLNAIVRRFDVEEPGVDPRAIIAEMLNSAPGTFRLESE